MSTDQIPENHDGQPLLGLGLSEGLGLVDDGQGDRMDALLLRAKDMICASQPTQDCSGGYTVPAAEWLMLQAEVMHRLREWAREGALAVLRT
jgi:hypothetical protein